MSRLLIPGGGASLVSSGYGKAGSILYDLAIEANNNGDFFPVWGTCLGFELLLYLSAGRKNFLTPCNSYNRAASLKFLSGFFVTQIKEIIVRKMGFGQQMPRSVDCTKGRRMTYWRRWAKRNRHRISITGAWRKRTWQPRRWTIFTDRWPRRRTTTAWNSWPLSKRSIIHFGACNSIRRRTSTNGVPIWRQYLIGRVPSKLANISPSSSSIKVCIRICNPLVFSNIILHFTLTFGNAKRSP